MDCQLDPGYSSRCQDWLWGGMCNTFDLYHSPIVWVSNLVTFLEHCHYEHSRHFSISTGHWTHKGTFIQITSLRISHREARTCCRFRCYHSWSIVIFCFCSCIPRCQLITQSLFWTHLLPSSARLLLKHHFDRLARWFPWLDIKNQFIKNKQPWKSTYLCWTFHPTGASSMQA